MDKDNLKKLKQLILEEMEFRDEFRRKRSELEEMVSPITRHVRECCKFWNENLPEAEEVLVIMDNNTCLKITKPKLEECSVESYLPFGMDFIECEVLDINKDIE